MKLYNADCLDIMRDMRDNEVDLIITDPPYGVNISHRVGGDAPFGGKKAPPNTRITPVSEFHAFDDTKIPGKEYFDEMLRVSKNQVIWGGNYFVEYLSNSPCWLVWDKDNSGHFADCEVAWTSFPSAVRLFKYRWNGMVQQNMKEKEIRQHSTQKPVRLFDWILEKYAEPGWSVFDPFMGSGSSAIAAKRRNHPYIGVELLEVHFEAAKARIIRELAQGGLF